MIKAVRGMHDILPEQSNAWLNIETTLANVAQSYGYQHIRPPLIESCDLFKRSIGENTDIVGKEMYVFSDKNGEALSLRPEGTAGCVRLMSEHNLVRNAPQKVWYSGAMFRRERPQKGRYRQFYQFGAEAYGYQNAKIDAELIAMSGQFWQAFDLNDIQLEINSLASAQTRESYKKKLRIYLNDVKTQLDADSLSRLEKNPLRILDSKNPALKTLISQAPKLIDMLDDPAKAHFDQVLNYLEKQNIDYQINPTLVRGLDYYNDTVFEWTTKQLGSQNTICAGGRYDGLAKQIGKQDFAGVGFALGLERLLLLLDSQNKQTAKHRITIYCVCLGDKANVCSFQICQQLRQAVPSLVVINDTSLASIKKQLSRADKLMADYAIIIAEDELKSHKITIKPLRSKQTQISIEQNNLIDFFQKIAQQ